MNILKVVNLLLVKYQLHLFTVVLYYAFMQFKINKRLEVQITKCNGRFNIAELKQSLNKDDCDKIKAEIKEIKSNIENKTSLDA